MQEPESAAQVDHLIHYRKIAADAIYGGVAFVAAVSLFFEGRISTSVAEVKSNMKDFKSDMKSDMKDLKSDMKDMKRELKSDISRVETKLDKVLEKLNSKRGWW